ncbi:DUF5057 domain-containing protein [Anaerobacillus alkaliphilus]|nr:DUF5057 domain-containing protein [Anaerobacillus alkaliphilus]
MMRKKLFKCLLATILVLSSFPFASLLDSSVEASTSMKKRVLEIVDSGESQLKSVLGTSGYEIDTIRMKRFVALREELDGKYDFIYIGSGNYSTAQVPTEQTFNTTNLMNDITNLKADEIINDYINKNQLVILHNDTITKNNDKLKNKFIKYTTEQRNNVKFINNVNEISSIVTNFYQQNDLRPRVQIIEAPKEYPDSKSYQANEVISFRFNVNRKTTNELTANLYIDANFNHTFASNELVQAVVVSGSEGVIQYKLPKGYSGLRYWKLEIVDRNTRLKDYVTGVFQFKGEKVNIKVLQVTSGENDNSRLTRSQNMNQSYLSTNDYHIHIDTVSMQNFTDSAHRFSHTKLNGNYNMIIFGFNDSYDRNTTLTGNAAKSVQAFINTGQSVMFTHDTIDGTRDNSIKVWKDHFQPITGQIAPKTNLGRGASASTTNTKKVNSGLLTQFPYNLADNIKIATTHNQYYTLNLEDPSVIPWYNITGSSRDVDDSWNHYYTYSKGTVTFSGTGHTNNSFPDEEQKLFVNTMFRAFLGANTAPGMNIISPGEGRHHLSSQNLELVYEAFDLDLTDRQLKTRVYINNSKEPIYTNNQVANGAIVRYTIGHEHLTVGTTTIRIEVEDSSGAIAIRERIINVQEAELNISKTVNKTRALIDESVTVTYSISLNNTSGLISDGKAQQGKVFPYAVAKEHLTDLEIPVADGNSQGNYGWVESNDGSGASRLAAMILAEERLDVVINQPITTEPGNMNMTETVKRWLNGQTKIVYLPIVEDYPNGRKDIPVKDIGIFEMFEKSNGRVYLRFKDYTTEMDHITLSNIKIQDFLPKGINLVTNKTNITKQDTSLGTNVTITLADMTLKQLLNQPVVVEYTIKSNQPGVYVMDQSMLHYQLGNSTQSSIPFNAIALEVVQPITGVQIRSTTNEIFVGHSPVRLLFDIIPDSATNKAEAVNSAIWTSSNPSVISIDQNGSITAHQEGNATIIISVQDVDGVNGGVPFTHSLNVAAILPLENIQVQGSSDLFVGDQQTYTIKTSPDGVNVGTVEWSIIQGNDIIELNNDGRLVAKKPGNAVIGARIVYRGKEFTATRTINVKQFSIDPKETEIAIGEFINLQAKLYKSSTVSDNITNVSWTSSDFSVASVNGNGRVEGKKEGTATITAKLVVNGLERTATAVVTVKKIPLTGIDADDKIFIEKGKTKDIQLTFTPSNATNKKVSFTSNRSGFANVDNHGRVRGIEVRYKTVNGELVIVPAATITITSEDDDKIKTTIDIIVIEPGSGNNGNNPGGNNGVRIGSDRW